MNRWLLVLLIVIAGGAFGWLVLDAPWSGPIILASVLVTRFVFTRSE